MRPIKLVNRALVIVAAGFAAQSFAQTWNSVAAPAGCTPFSMFMGTDGSLIVGSEYANSAAWWKYTPSATGSYTSGGTWTQLANSPNSRLYFSCGVLPDGRIPMFGGEYLNFSAVWTNKCDIYNPATNTWQTLTPPTGWANIGDGTCAVTADGRFYFANAYDTRTQFFNPATNTFTAGPTALNSTNEEGWTQLWDDTLIGPDARTSSPFRSERYNPNTNTWNWDGNVPVRIYTAASLEPGAGVTMPNGAVFHTGGPGTNAVYTPSGVPNVIGTWTAAPSFPLISGVQQGAEDAMCTTMPNGKVLCTANRASSFTGPTHLYEYDYRTNSLVQIADPEAISNPCYTVHTCLLPTGQVAVSYSTNHILIYTPTTTGINDAWRPYSIVTPSSAAPGDDILVFGEQINGLTQGSTYGDEGLYNSNFPVISLKNNTTGTVYYCRTHDHSTMSIGPNHLRQYTKCLIPASVPTGTYSLTLSANGLAQKTPNTIVINNTSSMISGNCTLQDFTNRSEEPGMWHTFELVNASSGAVVETQTLHTTETGGYQYYTDKVGTFYLRSKTFHFLSNITTSFTLGTKTRVTRNFQLLNGDVDEDNAVTIFDYTTLSDYFDRSEVDGGWYTYGANGWRPVDADLDGDGSVTIFDYTILSANFDKFGV
ncbi:MAG: hypothetical protein JST40_10710 [Armatimonadetes bacterium]|nr:hypothetical protein [Armatimonadota bacterium]